MVSNGNFREDLFYRLNVLSLPIPTLQERDDDVILLCEHFLKHFYSRQNKPDGIFSTRSAKILLAYDWPGNIRQLRNVMERLSVMTAGGIIRSGDVEKALQIQDFTSPAKSHLGSPDQKSGPEPHHAPAAARQHSTGSEKSGLPLHKEKALQEKRLIIEMLEACDGNKAETAKRLGISRTTLWRKLQARNDN